MEAARTFPEPVTSDKHRVQRYICRAKHRRGHQSFFPVQSSNAMCISKECFLQVLKYENLVIGENISLRQLDVVFCPHIEKEENVGYLFSFISSKMSFDTNRPIFLGGIIIKTTKLTRIGFQKYLHLAPPDGQHNFPSLTSIL